MSESTKAMSNFLSTTTVVLAIRKDLSLASDGLRSLTDSKICYMPAWSSEDGIFASTESRSTPLPFPLL